MATRRTALASRRRGSAAMAEAEPAVDAAEDLVADAPADSAGDGLSAVPTMLEEGTLSGVLGYQIALAAAVTQRLFARHVGGPLQLRPVDFSILMLLLANEDVTQKRLGQTLAVSAPNLTILLDRLQQSGLVVRVRSEADRRSQTIHLTDEGRAIAVRAQAEAGAMEAAIHARLTRGERLMLIELLQKVAHGRVA